MRKIIGTLILLVTTVGFAWCQQNVIASSTLEQKIELGVIKEISSGILAEKRSINIYLPDNYSENDTTKYPVIYLLDGSLDEDFIHVVGLVQFNTFSWINRLQKSIVVGIANTNRERDLSFPTTIKADKEAFPHTGGSAKFIAFIEKELQPYIQKQFRTNDTNTLIGQSLGGLLATEILFTKPALFNQYIIVSPSLWWDNGSLLKKNVSIPSNVNAVYIGVGKEGLAPCADPHVMEVDANLLADKIRKAGGGKPKVYFDYLPDENHATIMHQALLNAFRLMSGGK